MKEFSEIMSRLLACAAQLSIGFAIAVFSVSLAAKSGGWDEIPEEELEVASPKIDPDANAEFLYRDLYVNDSNENTIFRYHNRAKIFTEAGVKAWDKVDLVYQTGWRVHSIRARVIFPDGRTTELKKEDIFKRQIYKDGRFEGNAKSFSFPGLKPGCIVEYKWTASRAFWSPNFDLAVRAEWPTWKLDLKIYPYGSMASRIMPYNSYFPVDKRGSKYYYMITNQPAISSEPHLPPRKDFEPFVYMGYAPNLTMLGLEKYWSYRGGNLVAINRDRVLPKQKAIKQLAAKVFEGLTMPEKKLKAAYDYCANEITNISFYTNKYTEEEIEDLKENNSPSMTIRNGYGTRYDINFLFASLAANIGYSARLAEVENHRVYSYDQRALGGFNLSDSLVSIEAGGRWRFFDPGSSFLPYEVLNPENADATVLTTDKKYYYVKKTPKVADDYSKRNRIANVSIDEFGDLKGEVTLLYTGYSSLWLKRMFASMTEKEQKEYILENEWQPRLSRTVIDDFTVKYLNDRNGKLALKCSIEIPGYGDVLGERILINPSLFTNGSQPLFSNDKRDVHILFDYKIQVQDQVKLSIPEGFAIEDKRAVAGSVENELFARKSMISIDETGTTFTYNRYYALKMLNIGKRYYPAVKKMYEELNAIDSRFISIGRSE